MKAKNKKKTRPGRLRLDAELGSVIAISGIQYNPTHEWMDKVYRFHSIMDQKKNYATPHYGGSEIEAVLMEAKLELADPKTEFCIAYKYIHWPGDTTVLRVFELEDGTLWEQLTDDFPISVDPGQPIVRGQEWQDDWLLSNKAKECQKLIGSCVTRLHFLKKLSGEALKLHKSRLPRRSKK